jgi:hypothetical protein
MATSLQASKSELQRAKQSLTELKSSKDFKHFEDKWRDLLNYLEKCWIKSERECQHVKNKFEPWQGTFKALRRSDPLLKYLKQARDSDNHSVQEIIDKIPGHTTGKFLNPQGGHIERMVFEKGVLKEYSGDPMIIEFKPGKVEAKSVVNQGQTFTPPLYHRGRPLKNSKDPIEIAELGIGFYEDYLNQVEAKVFQNIA